MSREQWDSHTLKEMRYIAHLYSCSIRQFEDAALKLSNNCVALDYGVFVRETNDPSGEEYIIWRCCYHWIWQDDGTCKDNGNGSGKALYAQRLKEDIDAAMEKADATDTDVFEVDIATVDDVV